jgi:hypothetical protein
MAVDATCCRFDESEKPRHSYLGCSAQAAAMEAATLAFNASADWFAGEMFTRRTVNKVALQEIDSTEPCTRFGLSAGMSTIFLCNGAPASS